MSGDQDLAGRRLAYFPEGKHAIGHPDNLQTVDGRTIPARVPGNVELDLVRAGAIPEPFYADNVRRLRALEPCEWWYTREFTLPADEAAAGACWKLVFGRLDTLAYHYLWRVQRPACVIVGEPGPGKYLPVVVSNDSGDPVEVRYRVWDADGRRFGNHYLTESPPFSLAQYRASGSQEAPH